MDSNGRSKDAGELMRSKLCYWFKLRKSFAPVASGASPGQIGGLGAATPLRSTELALCWDGAGILYWGAGWALGGFPVFGAGPVGAATAVRAATAVVEAPWGPI